jgi:hypothetical protein
MASSLDSAKSRFACWQASKAVLDNIQIWRTQLSLDFCGSLLREPPHLSPIEFWVDASTSFGVGVVFNHTWDYWKFCQGWKAEGREIGWAEMLAIKLGL